MRCSHPHPCNVRIARVLDRGWGEIAFEYTWDSTLDAGRDANGLRPDLDHCSVYEFTTYGPDPGESGASGGPADNWYLPPDPPFADWRLRDPTDGRCCHVGLE